MDRGKHAAKRVIVWVVSALILAGLAADIWVRRNRADLERQLVTETRRASEVESKLAGAEATIKKLTQDLEMERSLRQRLEDLVNRGRK